MNSSRKSTKYIDQITHPIILTNTGLDPLETKALRCTLNVPFRMIGSKKQYGKKRWGTPIKRGSKKNPDLMYELVTSTDLLYNKINNRTHHEPDLIRSNDIISSYYTVPLYYDFFKDEESVPYPTPPPSPPPEHNASIFEQEMNKEDVKFPKAKIARETLYQCMLEKYIGDSCNEMTSNISKSYIQQILNERNVELMD